MAADIFLFDNPSDWYSNITSWTIQQLRSTLNATKYAPSLEHLVLGGPRLVLKLGSSIFSPDLAKYIARVPTDVVVAAPPSGLQDTHDSAQTESAITDSSVMPLGSANGLSSLFSYATSRWALCCILMIIIYNRTYIFAATRRKLQLQWPVRLLVRAGPVWLFAFQAIRLLQSIQCQTSPDFAQLRDPMSNPAIAFVSTQTNVFLHGLSSTLLVGASDRQSCLAVRMIPDGEEPADELRGSLSRLWPLFGTFCWSQFIETLSCSVQGRPMATETTLSLFEHSLAFAEADTAIKSQLGWGFFSKSKSSSAAPYFNQTISNASALNRANTPPEVLMVAFLSSMSHITSHVLGIFDLQARFRLASTAFWSLCFVNNIFFGLLTFSVDNPADQSLLRYPTASIVSFVPHILGLAGTFICFTIYGCAVALSALGSFGSHEVDHLTFYQRLRQAHGNMQSNISLAEIRITMDMDFYTAILRTGFGVMAMASEAVYLNEDREIVVKGATWLEDERLQEVERLRTRWMETDPRNDQIGAIGLVPVQEKYPLSVNGFLRERAAQQISKARCSEKKLRDGVGASERTSRWLRAIDYSWNVFKLLFRIFVLASLKILASVGIKRQPRWILRLLGRKEQVFTKLESDSSDSDVLTETLLTRSGAFVIPRSDLVDVEMELRKRLKNSSEQEFDSQLYRWWTSGGWWGTVDHSGDFEPLDNTDDSDNTSVVSQFAAGDELDEWISDFGTNDAASRNRAAVAQEAHSPIVDMDMPIHMSDLARLLDPSNAEEREEARLLSAHLQSDSIVTRSRYKKSRQLQRTQVLTRRFDMRGELAIAASCAGKLTEDEESHLLEEMLLSRRGGAVGQARTSWRLGGVGLGQEGPQCVVCQSTPRTIIVWPCRCLSLCDDCRVSLAMNNFDKCVCCRREVISFSRIYVP